MKHGYKLTKDFCISTWPCLDQFSLILSAKLKGCSPLKRQTRHTLLPLVFGFLSVFSSFSIANQCEDLFGSRLYFDQKALESARRDRQIQPNFFDIRRETGLVKEWDKPPSTPALLTALLPKDVHFINHQLYKPESPTVVKNAEIGDTVMARAHWSYRGYTFGANVAFSTRAIADNFKREGRHNYLASSQAKAVIFYFHGGGTTTTGAHTAHTMISHFARYGIDVVAVDLPWHGEGHRHFLNNFEMEIETLGAFVQKFIPPQVPLFVAGHSWGGVFAEKIMRMSDQPKEKFSFHRNLRGAIIMSTAITDLPEKKSLREVQEEYAKRTIDVLTNRMDEFPKDEMNIWTGMVMDGKISFLGGLYAKIMFQMSQEKPVHEGRDYIPALMIVGKYDPLVYLGFEKEYELYRALKNVKTVYLDLLPTLFDPRTKSPTGHLLGSRLHKDLLEKDQHRVFVHFAEMRQFIAETLGLDILTIEKQREVTRLNRNTMSKSNRNLAKTAQQQRDQELGIDNNTPDIIYIIQEWANSLSFRQFLRTYTHRAINTTNIYITLRQKQQQIRGEIISIIEPYTPKARVLHILNLLSNDTLNNLSDPTTRLYRILDSDDFIKSVGNLQLAQDLVALREQIKIAQGDPSRSAVADLKTAVAEFRRRNQSWLGKPNSNKAVVVPRSLIKSVFAEETAESAKQKLESSITNLPFDVRHSVFKLLIEYYDNQKLFDKTYIPSKDDIGWDSMTVEEQLRVGRSLSRVTHAVQNQQQFLQERSKINRQIEGLRGQEGLKLKYLNLLSDVEHHVSVIEKFLNKANVEPPTSLKEEYAQLEAQLIKLQQGYFKLDEITDEISRAIFEKQQPMRHSEIGSLLTPEQIAHVQQWTALFNQYIHNRADLVRKTIVAIENGEMKNEDRYAVNSAQSSVKELYGIGSDGSHSKVSSNSLYWRLEEATKQLARAESQMNKTDRLIVEEQGVYNNAINQLLNHSPSDNRIMRIAPLLFGIVELDVQRNILSGRRDHIDTERLHTDPAEMAKAIQVFKENADVFDNLIKTWRGLRSALPPPLPTERPNL